MRTKRILAIPVALGLAATALGGLPAAVAGDRPTNVVFVRTWKTVHVRVHGGLTVGSGVRCVPGWEGGEVDMWLSQGSATASGFVDRSVPCDNAWHPVRFIIQDVSGAFQPGEIHLTSQFIGNNVESGDSAGAHSQRLHGVVVIDQTSNAALHG
jgi:hypothetical protein